MAARTKPLIVHRTVDLTNRYAMDAALRAAGWRVHSRPRKGEPVWERGELVVSQTAAENTLTCAALRDARKATDDYFAEAYG